MIVSRAAAAYSDYNFKGSRRGGRTINCCSGCRPRPLQLQTSLDESGARGREILRLDMLTLGCELVNG